MLTQQTQNNFPGPKSYRDFRETGPRSENGYENDMFWSEIGSGFGEPAPPPPHQEFSGVLPPPRRLNKIHWTGGNDFRYYNWRWWNPYVCVYSGYVHTILNCFSFRHKKQSGIATAQNWNMSLNTSKIVPEQLTDSVLANQNSQYSLLNIYFRLTEIPVLTLTYSLPLRSYYLFTLDQIVTQNLSDMWRCTFDVGEAQLRSASIWFSCRRKS